LRSLALLGLLHVAQGLCARGHRNLPRHRHVFLSAFAPIQQGFEARGCELMYDIIYLVGLVVVVMFILSALGLR
jgi:hypothetical protein